MPILNLSYDDYTGGGVSAEQMFSVSVGGDNPFGIQGDYYKYKSDIIDFIFEGDVTRTRKIFWKLVKNTEGTIYTSCQFTIYDRNEVNYIRWNRTRSVHSTGNTVSDYYDDKGFLVLYNNNVINLNRSDFINMFVDGGLPIVDEDDVSAFIAGDDTVAINYVGQQETVGEDYYFYNDIMEVVVDAYGNVKPTGNYAKHYLRIYRANNKRMVLYPDTESQKIILDMETGIEFVKTEVYNEDTGQWVEYAGRYEQPWTDWLNGFNNTETGTIWIATAPLNKPNSNIPFFNNEEDAEDYKDGDPGAKNPDWNGDYTPTNPSGDDGSNTEMGISGHKPIVTTQYALNKSGLREFANWIYTQDDTLWNNLKKGLQLFGDNPSEAIINIMYWPCDVTDFSTFGNTSKMYLGGCESPTFAATIKEVGYSSKAKILGETIVHRTYNDYRDYAPYTRAFLYLPYCGEHEIDLNKFYGKGLRVEYYADLWSGRCMACVFATSSTKTLIDSFEGTMGVNQSFRATDFNAYMNNTIATGTSAIGSVTSSAGTGAAIGATVGTVVPGVGNVAGAIVGGAVGLGAGALKMKGNDIKHFENQIGATSGNLSENLPQSCILRFEYLETVDTQNLNLLKGRPSDVSGNISQFSGFLQCSDVKLTCSGATENEKEEIIRTLTSGIWI